MPWGMREGSLFLRVDAWLSSRQSEGLGVDAFPASSCAPPKPGCLQVHMSQHMHPGEEGIPYPCHHLSNLTPVCCPPGPP